MNFIEELKWRGMIHDIMPGTEEQFEKEMTSKLILDLIQHLTHYILVL